MFIEHLLNFLLGRSWSRTVLLKRCLDALSSNPKSSL